MSISPEQMEAPRVSHRVLRLTVAALVAGLIAVAVLVGIRLYERIQAVAPVAPPPIAVETRAIEPQPFTRSLRASGSIEAERRVVLSSQLAARVEDVPFREGAHVVKGDVLARLDDAEQRQEVARRQAALDSVISDLAFWRAQLRADRRLGESQAISQRALDETERRVRTLQAARREAAQALESARTRLGYAVLLAPFDGYVQTVRVLPGGFVQPGGALLELLAAEPLKAILPVAEKDLRQLRRGQAVELNVPAIQGVWRATVDRVFPALDRRTRSATIEVFLPKGADGVRPGMAAIGRIVLQEADAALVVPRQSLRRRGGDTGVYVLADGIAHWREVEPGAAQDGRVRIRAGLAPGEEVILTPHPQLADGRRVVVRNDWSAPQ